MELLEQKFSTLDIDFCKRYLRIEDDFVEDDEFIGLCLQGAKYYLLEYSDMTSDQLDKIIYSPIIILRMVAQMYTNKTLEVKSVYKTDPFTKDLLAKLTNYVL